MSESAGAPAGLATAPLRGQFFSWCGGYVSRKFTDNQGEPWVVVVDVDAVKEVRRALDIDLLAISAEELLERLATDYVVLADILFVVCRRDAATRGIDDVEFGRRLVGDPFDEARPAFLRALCDFFPTRRRLVLAAIVDKLFAVDEQMLVQMEAAVAGPLDRLAADEVAKHQRELDAILGSGGDSSTSSPGGSASSRVRTRSPSSSAATKRAAKRRGTTRRR